MQKQVQCRISFCTTEKSKQETGAISYGGGWYCNQHTRTHLVRAEDTGKLHYKTHLRRVVISDAFGSNRSYWFFTAPVTKECGKCCRKYRTPFPKFSKLKSGALACAMCIQEIKQKKYKIKMSSTNVLDYVKMRKPCSDGLLMGMEWEISCEDHNGEFAEIVLDAIGIDFAIHKYDGSVRGFELNTAPASLAMQKRRVFKACEAISEQGEKYFPGVNNAGIHIHIDRRFFITKEEVEKFISFFCISGNSAFVTAIAGRDSHTWAAKARKTAEYGSTKLTWYKGAQDIGKCSIVNVKHTNTLEVRAFASSLNFTVIAARLEFVACLARACKTPEFPEEASYLVFLEYLNKHKSMYPNLFNFTKEKF